MRPQEHLGEIVQRLGTGDGTQAVRELIEAGLFAEQEQEQQRRQAEGKGGPRLYVTDVGKCPALVYNRLMEVPETQPLTVDALVNFKIGHAVEDTFAELIQKTDRYVSINREIPLRLSLDPLTLSLEDTAVYGRADFLQAGELLVELKSASSRSLGWMLKRGEQGRPEHRSQLNLYLQASQWRMLGTPEQIRDDVYGPMSVGVLVYLVKDATKNEPVIHAFDVAYSAKQAAEDLNWFTKLWWSFQQGMRPPCDCGERFNKKGSLYCVYGPTFPCCERSN